MAKRGETRPWRVTTQFEGGKPFITTTHHSEEDAERAAARQRIVVGPAGHTCTATVSDRRTDGP